MKASLIIALIFAIANAAGTLAIYYSGQLVNLGPVYFVVIALLTVLFFALCVLYQRYHGVPLSLGKAFWTFSLISTLGISSGVLTKYAIYQVDVSLTEELRQKVLADMEANLKGSEVTGLIPAKDLEQIRKDMTAKAASPDLSPGYLGTMIFHVPFGIFASVLLAALLRTIPKRNQARS